MIFFNIRAVAYSVLKPEQENAMKGCLTALQRIGAGERERDSTGTVSNLLQVVLLLCESPSFPGCSR